MDAAVWETGFAVMALAVAGLWCAVRRRIELPATAAVDAAAVLCVLDCVWVGADLYSAALAALVLQLAVWDGDAAGAGDVLVLTLSWIEDWWDEIATRCRRDCCSR